MKGAKLDYHSKQILDVLQELETSKDGLSQKEAEERIIKYGYNEIKETERISPIQIFISQFKNFLVGILFIAMIISFFADEKIDALVIGIILILNALLGFIQEYRAEKAIQALKKMASLHATVLRDGKEKKIPAKELVPGDIILLETGEKIPADSRLIQSINIHCQEAALTGESLPVRKEISILNKDTQVADRTNMLFSGTSITSGRGMAVVAETGMETEIGKIAKMIQDDQIKLTPLQLKLKKLGHYLGIGIIIICIFIFIAGLLIGVKAIDMMMVSISLAVAAIPEGLPAIVTIALALGTQRMVKRHALIRKLNSVETLGSTTVICTDKTGTLTMNEMTVKKIFCNDKIIDVTGTGYGFEGEFLHNNVMIDPKEFSILLRIGTLCNNAKVDNNSIFGDPTEASLVVSAAKAKIFQEELKDKYPRLSEIEFTSERKMMSTLYGVEGRSLVYCKGAPDIILESCNRIYKDGNVDRLTKVEKEKILKVNDEFSRNALRVLGFAYKESDKLDEKELIFVGLQAMIDPPRLGVKDAILKCHQAGIRVVMITGDHKITAEAIAKEIGLVGKTIEGKELHALTDISSIVDEVSIYARVDPIDKVKILEALQKKGNVVAMTGDGVNDAPAIKKSDIGIAMGITGTDVAKEASDMILTDDNFVSIVNSVEEGRTIYSNIQKFIQYLLSTNIGEVLTVFFGIILAPFLGHHLPLAALQILWINLVTDGLPALALGVDPADKDVMSRKPRNPNENLVTKHRMIQMIFVGIIMTVGTLALFKYYVGKYDEIYAQTVAFTVLVMYQMIYVLELRSETKSFFVTNPFTNMKLIGAVAVSIILQYVVVHIAFFQKVFGTVALSLFDWVLIICVSLSLMLYTELVKVYYNVKNKLVTLT